MQRVLSEVAAAGSTLGRSARSSSSASDLADALQKFRTSVNAAADELHGVSPPAAAATGHAELERVLRLIADGVQPSIRAARKDDRAAIQRTFRAYQAKLNGAYRRQLTAAGAQIDSALAGQ